MNTVTRRFPAFALVASVLAVTACSGSVSPSTSAADPAPASTPTAEPVTKGAALKTTAPEPAAATTDTDAIAHAVLTHESFAMYLHPEVPGRLPVRVSSSVTLPDPLTTKVEGRPVEWVAASAVAASQPVVVFTKWKVAGKKADIELTYAIEGVAGTFGLRRDGDAWLVDQASVAEH